MASCCSIVFYRFKRVEGKCHSCNLADAATVFNRSDIQNKANWIVKPWTHSFHLWVHSVVWEVKDCRSYNQSVVYVWKVPRILPLFHEQDGYWAGYTEDSDINKSLCRDTEICIISLNVSVANVSSSSVLHFHTCLLANADWPMMYGAVQMYRGWSSLEAAENIYAFIL